MIRLHLVSAYKMRSHWHTGEILQYEKSALPRHLYILSENRVLVFMPLAIRPL